MNKQLQYLTQMEKYARDNKIPVILDDTRKYLESLVSQIKPKKILEIGMAIGYSASCFLLHSEAKVYSMEASLPNIELAKANFAQLGLADRVQIIEGDCVQRIKELRGNTYDFIFLDGPKGKYLQMLPDILALMDKNTVFVADNVLFRGMVLDGKPLEWPRFANTVEVLREFIKALQQNERLSTELLHIGDGLAVVKFR